MYCHDCDKMTEYSYRDSELLNRSKFVCKECKAIFMLKHRSKEFADCYCDKCDKVVKAKLIEMGVFYHASK